MHVCVVRGGVLPLVRDRFEFVLVLGVRLDPQTSREDELADRS